MKNFNLYKIVQLSIIVILSGLSIILLLQNNVKQFVFSTTPATVLFFVVWILMLTGFVFIFIDFFMISRIKLSYKDLYSAAYSDSLSSIPNRFSCDTIIDKYADTDLPEEVGCVMLSITNLGESNAKYGRSAGNTMLKDFSNILSISAEGICFVGRNGGNRFLAIFDAGQDVQGDIGHFLSQVEIRVKKHNEKENNIPISYNTGTAVNQNEHLNQITQLISLADNRLS